MSSKNTRAKKALRQAAWHRSRTPTPGLRTQNYPSLTANKPPQNQDQEQKRKLTPRQILSHFSYQDTQNKERIYTVESEKLVNAKMQTLLGYIQPLDVEYGEVLNRPGEACWWLSLESMPK